MAPLVLSRINRPGLRPGLGQVTIELAGEAGARVAGFVIGEDYVIEGSYSPAIDAAGGWSIRLVPNDLILPEGTVYKITEKVDGGKNVMYITVPNGPGPYNVVEDDLLTEAPGALTSAALALEIARAIAAEEDLQDQIDALGDDAVQSVDGRTGVVTLNDLYAPFAETAARIAADNAEAAARAAADLLLIPLAQKAAANGVATLDANQKLVTSQLPSLALSEHLGTVASQAAMLALVGERGDWCIRTDFPTNRVYILKTDDPTQVANWTDITGPGDVLTVDGRTGAVTLSDLYAPFTETAARIAADSALQDQIDDAVADIDDAFADIAAEAAARVAADALKVDKATFPVEIGVALSDLSTALTTGTNKETFRAPFAFTLTAVRASLLTASGGGTLVTVDINVNGASILSTKLTIDNGEKTSLTAATAAVISSAAIASDDEITFDIDQAGSAAIGLRVWLIGTRAL